LKNEEITHPQPLSRGEFWTFPPLAKGFRGGKFLKAIIFVKTEIQKALKILDSSPRFHENRLYAGMTF